MNARAKLSNRQILTLSSSCMNFAGISPLKILPKMVSPVGADILLGSIEITDQYTDFVFLVYYCTVCRNIII